MKLKDAPDRELINLLRASDSQAMNVLYDRYAGLVYSVAFKILQNNSDAEELTQDIFVSLWQKDNYTSHGHNLRFLTKSSNLVKSCKEEARED